MSLFRFDKPVKVSKARKPRIPKPGEPRLEFGVTSTEGCITMMLPLKTVSEGNCFEAWQKKHARHKMQQGTIKYHLERYLPLISLPCTITMTRYAPRELDVHDNLPYAFKWIYDGLCDSLIPGLKAGRADNDPRIQPKYAQIKNKEYALKIEIKWDL